MILRSLLLPLFLLADLSLRSPLAAGATPVRTTPNIVLIVADDLGAETLGSYGGLDYRTPVLDRLAAEGVRFTHSYAQPLCTPTRLQLLTGKYNHRNWVAFGIMNPRERTLGHLLQARGYRTVFAGKWQFYSYDPPDYPGAASRRGTGMKIEDAGFDAYSAWHAFHIEEAGSRYADPTIYENGRFRTDTAGRYGEDIWVEFIADFLARNRNAPVFALYAMALPHAPFNPTPHSPEWKTPGERLRADPRHFKAMVEYMDFAIGRLLARLEALRLRDDTVILFTSDNGTDQRIRSRTQRGPVAGGKGLSTDAGIRVPLIAWGPGRIPGGRTLAEIVDSTDFLPTLLELAGAPLADAPACDGISFAPHLQGRPGRSREAAFFWHDPRPGWHKDQFRRQIFALDRKYKLYRDGRFFRIEDDLLEQHPLPDPAPGTEAHGAREKLGGIIARQLASHPDRH